MGLLDKISDDFHHSRGQKDGAHGRLRGDIFNKKYDQGYDAGKFDYDKKKYGETWAKVAKAERDFARRISEGGKKSKVTGEEATMKEESHREVEYCPVCGDEYDGDYCYNCEDYYDDYDEEDELAWQEEQKKKAEEAEQKRRIIKEKTQGKHRMELENIILFEHDEDLDVKIAAINQLDVFSSYELEFSAQYDDSYSVREAAKKRLQELGLSAPPEINFKHSPINRLNLGYLKLQAMYETNPAIKKYARNKLEEYLNGPQVPIKNLLLRYKCTRCGHEWDSVDSEPKQIANCLMGCSRGDDEPSLLGFYKIIKGLITGKESFGYGKLIKSKKL